MAASFYDCKPEDEVNNNIALGQSHALAMLYGENSEEQEAGAVICQTIAALKPRESAYAVICDVSLNYSQHYNQHENRQWDKDEAKNLEPYKHELAKLAIENIEDIKTIYKECIKGYKVKSDIEREKAAAESREQMKKSMLPFCRI